MRCSVSTWRPRACTSTGACCVKDPWVHKPVGSSLAASALCCRALQATAPFPCPLQHPGAMRAPLLAALLLLGEACCWRCAAAARMPGSGRHGAPEHSHTGAAVVCAGALISNLRRALLARPLAGVGAHARELTVRHSGARTHCAPLQPRAECTGCHSANGCQWAPGQRCLQMRQPLPQEASARHDAAGPPALHLQRQALPLRVPVPQVGQERVRLP